MRIGLRKADRFRAGRRRRRAVAKMKTARTIRNGVIVGMLKWMRNGRRIVKAWSAKRGVSIRVRFGRT